MNKIDFSDAFQTLVNFDGLYELPKDKEEKILGPVVGYAGIKSTTDKMIELIKSKGAEVIAIACVFNRSDCKKWKDIPVLSVIHLHTPEYKQTDPEVKELIESGNVVWKAKAKWNRLKQAMKKESE